MRVWKSVALSLALLGAAGLGASYAPVGHGQSPAPRASAPRVAEKIFLGHGGRIGVSIRDVEGEDRKSANTGVVIESVDEDSPAEKAGLKKGDVVVEFDGERVRSVRQFTRLVTETPGGRTVPAGVMRDGSRVSLNITPRESNNVHFFHGGEGEAFDMLRGFGATTPAIPSRPRVPVPPMTPAPHALESFLWRGSNRLGLTVGALSPQLAEYFGTKDGILVSAVDDNSSASKAGVKAGDVITGINGQQVGNPAELRRLLARIDAGDEFSLGVVRERKAMVLKGKVDGSGGRRRGSRTVL